MSTIAFDTLKLAQRLEAAGVPTRQAEEMASALGETIGDAVVTRDHLDLRLGELKSEIDLRLREPKGEIDLRLGEFSLRLEEIRSTMATKVEVAEAKNEVLKWMVGAVGLQIVAILAGMTGLLRLFH